MLQKGSLPPEQQCKTIGVINRDATALALLVDDVLDTSRIVTGTMRVKWKACLFHDGSDAEVRAIR